MKVLVSTVLMLAVLIGGLTSPAFADSKSQTVRVSCVIEPQMQITRAGQEFSLDSVRIQSNFGEKLTTSEAWRVNGSQRTKLYTVTAL